MPKIDMYFHRLAIGTLILCLSCCSHGVDFADTSSASLSVQVTDFSGATVGGAHLILRNANTRQEQPGDTEKSGNAAFSYLKPGHYTLTVSKEGFADIVVDDIVLNIGDNRRLQLSLKVGSANQTVTVDGGGLQINTTDASVSTVIDRKFVHNIPLNGRSFQDLISMTPGVVTQSPQTTSQTVGYMGDFSVNGQRTESNYYLVDGVSANLSSGTPSGAPQPASSGSIPASTAIGTTQGLTSVDGLQEARIESSTYSAEYGHTPGGQFSLVTRSGTNEIHGSAFEYLRNNFFDANDWFNDYYEKPISPLRQSDFGGTFGGPVIIPKFYDGGSRTFFFVSYEGLRLIQPQAATLQYVPNTYARQDAPSAIQPILNAFPLPSTNGVDYGNGLAQFTETYSLPSQIDSTSFRIDEALSPRSSVFFRFADTPSSATTRSLSSVLQNQINTQTCTAGIDSQFSRSVTNQMRIGYGRSNSEGVQSLDSFGGAIPINLAAAIGIGSSPNVQALFEIYVAGIGSTYLESSLPENLSRQWNIVDTVGLALGRHQLKMGIDYRHIQSPIISTQNPYAGFIFESERSLLSNRADIAVLLKQLSAIPIFTETAVFAQDEWRLSKQLNLSIGLRWEVDPPPAEEHGNIPYTLLGNIADPLSLKLAPKGTALWRTTWYNFAPRLGLAWTAHAHPEWETILRSGVGIFFDTDNQLAANGFSGIGFSANNLVYSAPVPVTPEQLNFQPSTTPPYTDDVIYAFPAHLQLPYTLEWNASMEQALGKTQSLTLSYVGANGRRLIQQQELYLTTLNPNFGSVAFVPNGLTSNYQALQVRLQRFVSHGLQALMSYTWSHSLDFGSNDAALPAIRGNSDFDVRSNFQGGLSWDLPGKKGNVFDRALLNGWGFDGRFIARTGFPVTIKGNYLTNPGTGSQYYGNVNLVPDQPIYLYQSQYPGGRIINRAAFSLPSGNGAGDAPRNFVRGFGESQVNLSARRQFQLSDKFTIEFRAEAFNILNHPNFGYIDPTLTDAQFGQSTQMLNQSLGTMSPLYQQGGARSMQFALRLSF